MLSLTECAERLVIAGGETFDQLHRIFILNGLNKSLLPRSTNRRPGYSRCSVIKPTIKQFQSLKCVASWLLTLRKDIFIFGGQMQHSSAKISTNKCSANTVMYNEYFCCNLYTKRLPRTTATHIFEFCHGTGLVNS